MSGNPSAGQRTYVEGTEDDGIGHLKAKNRIVAFGRGNTLSRGCIDETTNLACHLGAGQTSRTLLGVPSGTQASSIAGINYPIQTPMVRGQTVGIRLFQFKLEVTRSVDSIRRFIGRASDITRYLYLMHCRAADRSTLCSETSEAVLPQSRLILYSVAPLGAIESTRQVLHERCFHCL